jgi:hypothetical protein
MLKYYVWAQQHCIWTKKNTVQLFFFNLAPMQPDRCQIIQHSRLPKNTYSDLISYRFFYYCFYMWAAQLIKGVFRLDMSFSCWFKGIRVPFYSLWSLLSFYQGCWRTRRLWISCLHSWRIWWSWRKGVKRYHNGQRSNILGALLCRTSRPVTVFLNCQSRMISRVSAFRFREFYWTSNHSLHFDPCCTDARKTSSLKFKNIHWNEFLWVQDWLFSSGWLLQWYASYLLPTVHKERTFQYVTLCKDKKSNFDSFWIFLNFCFTHPLISVSYCPLTQKVKTCTWM